MNLIYGFLSSYLIVSCLAEVKEFHDNQYIIDYIKGLGYPLTIYDNITTSDGYILTLFRITRDTSTFKTVVFLMHGFLASAECWFMNKPKKTLPFLLSDDGHDVWIGNARGTYHSLKHVRYNSRSMRDAYWNYSFHETAVYDQPAMIDFILDIANCKKLVFIGHSLGTTTYLAMASELPQYTEEKVSLAMLLGVSAFFDYAKSNVLLLARFALSYFPVEAELFGGVFPLINSLLERGCINDFRWLCIFMMEQLVGNDPEQLDESSLHIILKQFPGPFSMKGAFHYFQIMGKGNFGQYDYDEKGNLKHYDSVKAPIYNLSNVPTKVLLYYSSNDLLSAVEDVTKVHNLLPDSEMVYVNYSKFNHVDYLTGKDVDILVYDSIRKRINQVGDFC